MFLSVTRLDRRTVGLLLMLIAGCPALLLAGTPVTYYNGADASTASKLKASLHSIVTNGDVRVGYDNTFPALYITDEDPANTNNVLMVYGRDSRPKTSTGGNDSSSYGGWNREHIFPQSFFNSIEPHRSDLHALMPCDADINSARSNYPYEVISTTPNYSDVFGNKRTGGTNPLWEPTNIDKGRVARAVLYMDVRYEGTDGTDLTIINSYPGGTGAGQMAYLNTVLEWHRQYPPTAWERARNQKVYNRQKNANPFVDHPEWASIIYGGTAWSFADNDTPTVSSTPRTSGFVTAGTSDVPMISLNLDLTANQFHIDQVGISRLGTLTDAEVSDVKLWYDVDGNGTVSVTDTLLDTQALNGGAATFNPSEPFYVAPGTGAYNTKLLITASIASSATSGRTLQMRVNSNAITADAGGGADTTPVFTNQDSNTVTVGSSLTNGDSITYASASAAPPASVAGSADVPMLSLALSLTANEWDLGQLNIARLGTIADSAISAVNLYLDSNNNDALDAGEQLLATTAFSAGTGSLLLNPAYRLSGTGTSNLLITASIGFSAIQDSTAGVRVTSNGILSSSTGGSDLNPSNPDLDSSLVTITASTDGGSNLVVSEVYEGSGNLKYVEFHNMGSTLVNLADYTLRRYANGSLTPATMTLQGSLAPGAFHVVANNSTDFVNVFGHAANQYNGSVISHNGNDCYDLVLSGAVVDSFAADRAANDTVFASDIVAFRVGDQLPNNGAWGSATSLTSSTGLSTTGYWGWTKITTGNANATSVATPGSAGGSSGAEVPIILSSLMIE